MARLLRGTAYYKLGQPILSGPSAAPDFVAEPILVFQSRAPRQVRQSVYSLREPVVLSVFDGPFTALSKSSRSTNTSYVLREPATLQPGSAPEVRVTNTLQRKSVQTHSVVRAPSTLEQQVATGFVATPVRTYEVRRPSAKRFQIHYNLGSPLAPSGPSGATVRVSLAVTRRAVENHPFQSQVYPPAIVNPDTTVLLPITYGPQTTLAPSHRISRVVKYFLNEPATLVAAVTPVETILGVCYQTATGRSSKKYRGRLRAISAPIVVTPFRPPTHVKPPLADPNYFLLIHS